MDPDGCAGNRFHDARPRTRPFPNRDREEIAVRSPTGYRDHVDSAVRATMRPCGFGSGTITFVST